MLFLFSHRFSQTFLLDRILQDYLFFTTETQRAQRRPFLIDREVPIDKNHSMPCGQSTYFSYKTCLDINRIDEFNTIGVMINVIYPEGMGWLSPIGTCLGEALAKTDLPIGDKDKTLCVLCVSVVDIDLTS